MTILNTGSNKKFSSGWEKIFSGKETRKKEDVSATPKPKKKSKPAAKKKPAPAKKSKKK